MNFQVSLYSSASETYLHIQKCIHIPGTAYTIRVERKEDFSVRVHSGNISS